MTLNITLLEPALALPFPTVIWLNLAHRISAVVIMVFLVTLFSVACALLGTCHCRQSTSKKTKGKLSLLMNFSLAYCIAKLSAEVLRMIGMVVLCVTIGFK
jgi:succinate dehydrogenase/fumarate reductase cytochrome b subunit